MARARRVFEQDGTKVVCDAVSLQFLKGAKVEFEDSLMRSAFVVRTAVVLGSMYCMCAIRTGVLYGSSTEGRFLKGAKVEF